MTSETNIDVTVGRILHYVYDDGKHLRCRPALVTAECPDQGQPGLVNLALFLDGFDLGVEIVKSNEIRMQYRWEAFVAPNHAVKVFRSWHWPRECSSLTSAEIPYIKHNQRFHHTHASGAGSRVNCFACSLVENDVEAKE